MLVSLPVLRLPPDLPPEAGEDQLKMNSSMTSMRLASWAALGTPLTLNFLHWARMCLTACSAQ